MTSILPEHQSEHTGSDIGSGLGVSFSLGYGFGHYSFSVDISGAPDRKMPHSSVNRMYEPRRVLLEFVTSSSGPGGWRLDAVTIYGPFRLKSGKAGEARAEERIYGRGVGPAWLAPIVTAARVGLPAVRT